MILWQKSTYRPPSYRSVCVSPDQHTPTGLKWHFAGDDKPTFRVDTKLPFGSRKSPAIFNRISKSVQRMMIRKASGNSDVKITIYKSTQYVITWEWWRDILASHVNQRHIWDIERPLAWLYTDASSCGGGAFCHGDWLYVNWRMDTNLADTHA